MLGTGADRLCTPSTATGPFRLFGVPGFNSRANDVVYCPPIIRDTSQQEPTAVVYFGGDVQDFPESMETNRDSRGYMKYNLENSAILLREAFPHSHIIVIRPVRMEFKTFSCFDNFVRGNNAGVPDHTPMNHALQHLERLLQNLSQRLINLPESEIEEQAAQSAATAAAIASATAAASLNASTADSNNISTVNKISSMHAAAASSSVPTTITIRRRMPKSTNYDNNSDSMDIDIMHVNDNSTTSATNDHNNCKHDNPIDATKNSNTLNNGTMKTNDNDAAVATGTDTDTDADGNMQQDNGNDNANINANANANNLNANENSNANNINANCDVNMGKENANANENEEAEEQQQEVHSNPLWWREHLNLDKAKLHLIGFSKGCVVLNQFIYEFHYMKTLTPDDSTMGRLLSRIKEMYWLDGGHGGQKNTWITSRSLLETLTRMGINAHVHLTPYQVQDERRPWIRKEEKLFSDMLKKLGCIVIRQLHYENQTPNLMTHFEVLNAFCQFQNQMQHQVQINQQIEQKHQQQLLQQQQQQQQQQLANQNQNSLGSLNQNQLQILHHQQQQQQQQQQQLLLQQHPNQQQQLQQHFQNENGNDKTSDDTNPPLEDK